MAGFDHSSDHEQEAYDQASIERNAHLGNRLFIVYATIYAGFILVNALRPDWMDWSPIEGVNLAVIYGMALIGGAIAISLIYGWMCRTPVKADTVISEAAGKHVPKNSQQDA